MVFQSNGVTYAVREEDIYYIESLGRKLIIHLQDKEIEIYGKISGLEEELGKKFYLIHRSYVVNMSKILSYSKKEVVLQNGEKLPLSKYRFELFRKEYTEYLESR